jgi:poly(hydroxyalkanoate) depolymerase family esterase
MPDAPGARIISDTFTGRHGSRRWRLAMPSAHTAEVPRPMLVMLHGCLQDAEDIARGTALDVVAEAQGILVLFPEQPESANPRKCWNWFESAHQERDAGEPALLAELIAHVSALHGADPHRVHLAGISAGGAMAALTAVAYPERFASLTVFSGVAWRAARSVSDALAAMQRGAEAGCPTSAALVEAMGPHARRFPVLVVHGGSDEVVSIRNAHELVTQFIGVWERLSDGDDAGALEACVLPQVVEHGYTVRETQWRDAAGMPQVTLLRIEELGHAWSGGARTGSFTDERGPAVSARLGEFVAHHP